MFCLIIFSEANSYFIFGLDRRRNKRWFSDRLPEITETDVVDARAFHLYTTKKYIIAVRYCAQMYTHRVYNIVFCRSPKTFFCREHLSKTTQRVGYKGVEPEKQRKKTLGNLLRDTRHTRMTLGVATIKIGGTCGGQRRKGVKGKGVISSDAARVGIDHIYDTKKIRTSIFG